MYLLSELNITTLWKMYNDDRRSLTQHIKLSYFRRIFCTSFNIGFGAPTVDQYSKCIQYTHKIEIETNHTEKEKLQFEFFHKEQADAYFNYLQKKPDDCFILSFDIQKNLVLLKVSNQIAYYRRQLYCYNLAVVRGTSKDHLNSANVTTYTWIEDQARKSSNEVALVIFNELTQYHDLTNYKTICFVADGCPGQNKNFFYGNNDR